MKKDPVDKANSWIDNNPNLFGKGLSLIILTLGILLIVGAVKDWDWLYKPDDTYHTNWTVGKISRYLGRRTARICGASVGLFILIPIGAVMTYSNFIKGRA